MGEDVTVDVEVPAGAGSSFCAGVAVATGTDVGAAVGDAFKVVAEACVAVGSAAGCRVCVGAATAVGSGVGGASDSPPQAAKEASAVKQARASIAVGTAFANKARQ